MPTIRRKRKYQILHALGAHVEQVRPVSIVDAEPLCQCGAPPRRADERGFFLNQFENLANARAHYATHGPRDLAADRRSRRCVCRRRRHGRHDCWRLGVFCASAMPAVRIVLADPPGSGLFNKVRKGVMYDAAEAEGQPRAPPGRHRHRRRRHQSNDAQLCTRDTSTTHLRVSDSESVHMARYLMRHDALFVGSSSALNCVGAVKLAAQLPRGSVIVTMLCDSGTRHLTKFWNDDYLARAGIVVDESLITDRNCIDCFVVMSSRRAAAVNQQAAQRNNEHGAETRQQHRPGRCDVKACSPKAPMPHI
jgi:cysteine synthase A